MIDTKEATYVSALASGVVVKQDRVDWAVEFSGKPADTSAVAVLLDALEMAESRWRDLGDVIREHGKYDNVGFCTATADRCRAALDTVGCGHAKG